MASTFLVSDILESAAREANVPDFASDTSVTLSQATMWLVQGARSFSARLRQTFGTDGDFLKVATVTTVPSLSVMSLPSDAGEIHSVVWARTSTDYRLLAAGNMEVLEDLADGDLATWAERQAPSYRLEGETLSFYPPSTAAETIILFYTTHLDLTDATYFASRLDADRWLVLDVAARVMRAQGRDPSMILQEKAMLEASLFSPARNRQPTRVYTIRDTRGAEDARAFRDRWSR